MVFLLEGLQRIRDLIFDDIDKGQLGTDGIAPSENDTGLISADATTLLDVDTKTKGTKSIKFNYTLPSTGGTTTTYKEFEFQKSSTPVNYNRIVFTGTSFTSGGSEDLNITQIFYVRGGN